MNPSVCMSVEMEDICKGCAPLYYEVIEANYKNNEASLEFFQAHGVLPRKLTCPKCGNKCRLRNDRHIFRCYHTYCLPKTKKRRSCGYSVSLLKGSFLDNSHIEMWKALSFIHFFLDKHFTHSAAQENLVISSRTSIDWARFCGEVCENWLQYQDPIGGEGVIVEIGETLAYTPKKEKACVLSQVWLFGGIERVSKKWFLLPISDDVNVHQETLNKETLVPLIKKFIRPGTTICCDSFNAYNSLNEEFSDWCKNHNVNFLNPKRKNNDTQNVNRLWIDLKEYVNKRGIRPWHLQQYIARYIFLKHYKDNALHHFLIEAGKIYSPLSDRLSPSSSEEEK